MAIPFDRVNGHVCCDIECRQNIDPRSYSEESIQTGSSEIFRADICRKKFSESNEGAADCRPKVVAKSLIQFMTRHSQTGVPEAVGKENNK